MKVTIPIEFEVETNVDELSEVVAKEAAHVAAWNALCMTQNGQDVTEEAVEAHVDGFGQCKVKLCEGEVEG